MHDYSSNLICDSLSSYVIDKEQSKLIWHQPNRGPACFIRVFEIYPSTELWSRSNSSCSSIQIRNVEYLLTRPCVKWNRSFFLSFILIGNLTLCGSVPLDLGPDSRLVRPSENLRSLIKHFNKICILLILSPQEIC